MKNGSAVSERYSMISFSCAEAPSGMVRGIALKQAKQESGEMNPKRVETSGEDGWMTQDPRIRIRVSAGMFLSFLERNGSMQSNEREKKKKTDEKRAARQAARERKS